jgi:hypothetical protein
MSQPEATDKKPSGIVRRLMLSGFFWIILILVGFHFFFERFDPLDVLGAENEAYQLVQGAVKHKSSALRTTKQCPDVAVIGSSLPMSAVFYGDCKHYRDDILKWVKTCEPLRISAFQAYHDARYLQEKLSQACGRPVSVTNLTSAAAMPSDAYLILSDLIKSQPNLRVVVYGVAPRDFMDNLVPEVGLTPAFEVLANPAAIPTTITQDTPPAVAFEVAASSLCSFYRQRANLRELASSKPSQVLNREMTLAKAAAKYANGGTSSPPSAKDAAARAFPVPTAEAAITNPVTTATASNSANVPDDSNPVLAAHYKDYYNRYNPANKRRFRQEMDQFKKVLTLCRDRHIQLFVVNMPIAPKNKQMIDKGMYAQFNSAVSQLPAEYGATYINMDEPTYDPKKDYMDSVHLNDEGAPKFTDALVRRMVPTIVCARKDNAS